MHAERIALLALSISRRGRPMHSFGAHTRLVASHQYRIPDSVFPAGPTAHPLFPPSPEIEPPGLRETPCAMPRQELDPEQQESGRASSAQASDFVRTAARTR